MSPVEAGEHKRTNQMTPTHLPFPSSVQINAQLRGSKEGVLENQHGTFVGQVQYQLETPPPHLLLDGVECGLLSSARMMKRERERHLLSGRGGPVSQH
jgi:hypothetical protein